MFLTKMNFWLLLPSLSILFCSRLRSLIVYSCRFISVLRWVACCDLKLDSCKVFYSFVLAFPPWETAPYSSAGLASATPLLLIRV